MAKRTMQPDAWMALVLRTMGVEELRQACAEETDPTKLQWLRNELLMKTRGNHMAKENE